MKKITTLSLLFLVITFNAFSQGLINYDADSKWFLGLNMGVAWNTSDVQNKNNYGYGLTFGRSFNYNYGKKMSFDIRARYLRGYWLGQDVDSTAIGSAYSGVLSQEATNYKDSLGYTVHNFQADVHRLGLELVLHANGVRERSNWDPYIFGGIGFTWYQTYGDLLQNDSAGAMLYDYESIKPFSKSSISGMLDNTYDTPLDGSNSKNYTVGFMPSLGFGLGYQIAPRVSIGIEHKTTFTQVDNFDGVALNGKYKQDIYHYTSGYLRFQLKAHHTHTAPDPITPVIPPPTTGGAPQLPVVIYKNPSTPGTTVHSPNYTVVADVQHVAGWENIRFKQDGVINNNFTYNTTTRQLESNVLLHLGQNNFEITGTNAAGSDVKTTSVTYERESGTPPIVTITNPSSSRSTVSNLTYNFVGNILNIQTQSQVKLTLNGKAISNFNYNSSTYGVTATLNLLGGTNTVVLSGTNSFGTDSKTVVIDYQSIPVPEPPVVTIKQPASNPLTVSEPSYTLKATVIHVTTAGQIKVLLNGQNIQNFNFVAATNTVTAPLNLIPGTNTIVVTGTNTVGTDSKQTALIYQRTVTPPVVQKPVVTFVAPGTNPHSTTSATCNVDATVANVTASSGVKVTINGTNTTNFSFNPSTTVVSFSTNLIEGANVISITGTNTAGIDSKNQTIVYSKLQAIVPPKVTFITPASDPFSTLGASCTVTATVTNVTASSNITVKVNGNATSNFTFNPSTTQVVFTASLIEGTNVLTVAGTNTAGTDSKTQTILYTKPIIVPPPVVTFTAPSANPYSTMVENYTILATVKNVTAGSGIKVSINGTSLSNFTFNAATTALSFPASFIEGSNVISITGTNTAGTDTKTQTIVYTKPEVILPPVVTMVLPAVNPYTSALPSTNIHARVTNVSASSGILVTLNGSSNTNFSFNPSTSEVTLTANLQEGSNTLIIKGTNTAGVASKTQTIHYIKPPVVLAPVVTFLNPSSSGTFVTKASFNVMATVLNVENGSQIVVKKDEEVINSTAYSYNPSTKKLSFNTVLNPGNNQFVVTGTNSAGVDSKTTVITYRVQAPPCDKPIVKVISPSTSPITSASAAFSFTASVLNIGSSNQIQLLVNGKEEKGGVYESNSNIFSANFNLLNGKNTVELIATNECGTVKDSKTINFSPVVAVPCEKPKVTPITPAQASSQSNDELAEITARLDNVENEGQITLTVNNKAQACTFNTKTSTAAANVNLQDGANTIKLSVSTACGTASYQWTIDRNPCKAPIIKITSSTAPDNGLAKSIEYNITATVNNVEAASQISVSHNGKSIDFDWDADAAILKVDVHLARGVNKFIITTNTDCGSSTQTRTATFNQGGDVNQSAPSILVTCPSKPAPGSTVNVSGSVTNITSAEQLVIKVNGQIVTKMNPVLTQGIMTFKVPVEGVTANSVYSIEVVAKNTFGSSTKTCSFKVAAAKTATGSGKPGTGSSTPPPASTPGKGRN